MLTFSGQLEKILDGTKTMTTRHDTKHWYWSMIELGSKLDMWWKNPRTKHPECYKIGIAVCSRTHRCTGQWFTSEDARKDGFDSLRDYKVRLGELNNLPHYEVDRVYWTQIEWDGWIDGPHKPRRVA